MIKPFDTSLIMLYDSYEKQPIIKSLIQILSVNGLPVGSVVDTSLGVYVNNLKLNRLKCFFDELNSGNVELTDDLIEQNAFLSAYFSTVHYIVRTRSDEKMRNFARILKKMNDKTINIDEFEDYTSIFNELSEREFVILTVKYKYEQGLKENINNLNPAELTDSYWLEFKNEVCIKTGLSEKEFDPMLVRLQRTGCYNKHKGYWDDSPNEKGDTTELFKNLYNLIAQ